MERSWHPRALCCVEPKAESRGAHRALGSCLSGTCHCFCDSRVTSPDIATSVTHLLGRGAPRDRPDWLSAIQPSNIPPTPAHPLQVSHHPRRRQGNSISHPSSGQPCSCSALTVLQAQWDLITTMRLMTPPHDPVPRR